MAWMHEEPDEDAMDIHSAHEAAPADERNVVVPPLRPILGQCVFGLPPAQLSDGERVSNSTPSTSRANDIPSTFDQQTTISNPAYVDIEIAQAPAEPAARILPKIRQITQHSFGWMYPRGRRIAPTEKHRWTAQHYRQPSPYSASSQSTSEAAPGDKNCVANEKS